MPMYQPPRWQPPRKHGLQLPLSRDQLGAILAYPVLTTAFYLICGFYLPTDYLPVVLGIYTALVVVAMACWFYVSLTDPAQPGGIACLCMKQTQSHSRYCASCRKSVPGLDHHCLWLNTCIGTRNYFFFFVLAVTGTLQFALQTAISILLLTHWLHTAPYVQRQIDATVGSRKAYSAFMVIHAVGAGIAFLSFASLCVFHTHLQGIGLGTYDWILSQRTPAAATVAIPRPAASATTTPQQHPQQPRSQPLAAATAAPPTVVGGSNAAGVGGEKAPEHVAVTIPPSSAGVEMVARPGGPEGGQGNGNGNGNGDGGPTAVTTV